jgi:hypothetical protein
MKMDKSKQIIDEIEDIIKSNYNNKDLSNKINSIIKLLIENLDTISNIDKIASNSLSSSSDKPANANNSKININKTNINCNDVNPPIFNIANTSQSGTCDSDGSYSSSETYETISESDTTDSSTSTTKTPSDIFKNIVENITGINDLKTQLCLLPLNPYEQEYININITPLLTVASDISNISVNLANSVDVLTTSPIVPRKKTKLKDSINEIYNMNEETIRLYKIIKKRLNEF